MLVLSRKSRETIRIGDQIVVTILRVQGRTIRVGIEAPSHIRVLRGEVAEAAGPSPRDAERLAEAEALVEAEVLATADGQVSASFEAADDLEIECDEAGEEVASVLPLRRLERRFPMGPIAARRPRALTAVTAN